MRHALFLPLLLALQAPAEAQVAPPLPAADNCEPIRQQIEARFRAGGVQATLAVVDAAAAGTAGARVVGSCGNGRRQIVRLGQAPLPAGATAAPVTPAAPATPAAEPRTTERLADRAPEREPTDKIPTECKDGSIVIGPNCDDPRAVRMTSAELAASLAPAKPASSPAAAASAAQADLPGRPASR